MGFMSWLTGRDEKQSDVYANFEKVDTVVENIKSVGKNEVETARDAVHEAMNKLNNVNGLAEYVGTVNIGDFDGVFDGIASGIEEIGNQIQAKANDIKTYEESEWYEKLGSTFAMGAAKFGEGILSVAEDIGDGVVSVVGWVAPKDSGFEKSCSDFVEKEWSHDAFNFYYESDFAKKSTFTEDSAAAAGFKIAGSTTGYLALGGVASGFGGSMAANSTGRISKAAGTFMKSTTRMNTLSAGLSGMGSGTEANLHKGLSMNDAAWEGAKQGASQAVVAYGFGKLGEKKAQNAKDKAISQAQENVDNIEKQLSKAEDTFDSIKKDAQKFSKDIQEGKVLGSEKDFQKQVNSLTKKGKEAADEVTRLTNSLDEANSALSDAKNIKIQGYSDTITKKGQKFGEKLYDVGSKGTKALSDTVVAGVAIKSKAPDAALKNQKAINSKETFKQSLGLDKVSANNMKDGMKNGINNAKNGINNVKNNLQTLKANPVQAVKNGATTVGNGAKKAWTTTKNGVTSIPSVITGAAMPGVTGAALNATGREMIEINGNSDKAQNQFRRNIEGATNSDKIIGDPEKDYSDIDLQNRDDNKNPNSPGGEYKPVIDNRGGGGIPGPDNTVGDTGNTPDPNPGDNNNNTNTEDNNQNSTDNNTNTNDNNTNTNTDNNTNNNTDNNNNNNNNSSDTGNNNNGGGSTIVTPPSDNGGGSTTIVGGGNSQHTGGGFTGSGGFTPGTGTNADTSVLEETSPLEDAATSIDDVIKGNKYTKIPTSNKPITTTTSESGGGSAVIPIVAGLSAAAAAGIGAKVYMDRKKNNDTGEEIDTEEWSGEDQIELDYTDDIQETENYLDDDDDYGYQTEKAEKYDARSSEELADLQ